MKKYLIALFFIYSIPSYGTLSVSILHTSNVDAMIQVTGVTGGDCTILVDTVSPPVTAIPDVDNSKYSGSNTCLGRQTAKQAGPDGSGSGFLVLIGTRVTDRGLSNQTTYYIKVTSGSDTVNTSFTTEEEGTGNSYPWAPPFDDRLTGNRGWPISTSLLLNKAIITDPLTGIKHYPAAGPKDITMRTTPQNMFTTSAPGTWTNPNNIINAGSSNASTAGANLIDVYPVAQFNSNFDVPYLLRGYNDLGVEVWDKGSNPYTVQIYKNNSPCGNPITITPQSAVTFGLNSGAGLDSTYPPTFPTALFGGSWGGTCIIEQDNRATENISGCSLTTVTTGGVTTATLNSVHILCRFQDTIKSGTPIYIAGSSCNNNICHANGTPTHTSKLILQETLASDVTGVAFQVIPWWFRVTPGSGGLQLGMRVDYALGWMAGQPGPSTPEHNCGQSWTNGFGETGKLCRMTTSAGQGIEDIMWFFGIDSSGKPVSRPFWLGEIPSSGYFTGQGFVAGDIPNGAGFNWWAQAGVGLVFDGANGKVFYLQAPGVGGSTQVIYKITYTGDMTEGTPYGNYSINNADMNGHTPCSGICSNMAWSVVIHASTTLASLIQTFDSYYATNSAFYFNSTPVLVGATGTAAYLQNSTGCSQNCASLLTIMDTSSTPWTIVNVIDTLSGRGSNGRIRFGGMHNFHQIESIANTGVMSSNFLNPSSGSWNPAFPFGGPFVAGVAAIKKGGVFNADTSLPATYDGSYDGACPGGIPSPYNIGATGNRCFTAKMPKNGWCDTVPSASEKSTWPCPNISAPNYTPASYAQPGCTGIGTCDSTHSIQIKVGDQAGAPNGGSEPIRVVQITNDSDPNYIDVVWERNSSPEMNCQQDWQPSGACTLPSGTYAHSNGWVAQALSSQIQADGAQFVIVGKTESGLSVQEVGGNIVRGHADLFLGTISGNTSWANANQLGFTNAIQGPVATFLSAPITEIGQGNPRWHGAGLSIGTGGTQSYVVGNGGTNNYIDTNAANNASPAGPENPVNYGTNTLTTTSTANVYIVTSITGGTLSATDYKNFSIPTTAARYNFRDVSGPASDITASPYTICFVYVNGQCFSSSTVGQIYVNVPGVDTSYSGSCWVSSNWFPMPCPFVKWPGVGESRQSFWTRADPFAGGLTRTLGYGMNLPAVQYSYATMTPITSSLIWVPVSYAAGWGAIPWLLQVPTLIDDTASVNRTDYINFPVTVGSGHNFARVMFGMTSDYKCKGQWALVGGSPAWSGWPEACVTDNSAAPYKWVSESQTALACSSGCTINLPLIPQAQYFTKQQFSVDGTTWTDGPLSTAKVGTVVFSCFDLAYSPTSASVSASGGTGTITLTVTDQTCASVNSSNQTWLTLTTATGGCTISGGNANCTGNGTFSWSAGVNGGSSRVGNINPDSSTSSFTLSQSGASAGIFKLINITPGIKFTPKVRIQ